MARASIFLLALAACSALPADLLETGQLVVETRNAEEFRHEARAFEVDGALVVEGSLHAMTDRRRAVQGSVVLELLAPDGGRLGRAEVELRQVRHGRWGHAHGEYRARFATVPPAGSRLVVELREPGA